MQSSLEVLDVKIDNQSLMFEWAWNKPLLSFTVKEYNPSLCASLGSGSPTGEDISPFSLTVTTNCGRFTF
jgi:hypothetical protein